MLAVARLSSRGGLERFTLMRAKGPEMAKKKAKKVATEFPLTISFDSSKLRGEFTAWLRMQLGDVVI